MEKSPKARRTSGIFPVSPANRPNPLHAELEPETKPTGPLAPVVTLADFRKKAASPTSPAVS